ncbi:hypothetical protein MKK50_13610 [Methylobacterium sp. J-043]|nr:hypothetical protein [Methylobacterium sp. J-043]
MDACHACRLDHAQRDPHLAAVPLAVQCLQTRQLAVLANNLGTTVGPWQGDAAFRGVRSLVTVARHPDVLPALRSALGFNAAATSASRFERMRAGDRAIILETIGHWLSDWSTRFIGAAGRAGLTQRSFCKVGQPGSFATQILRLPEGFARDRTFVPLLQDRALKRLRRQNRAGYRRVRAARFLEATARRR